MAEALTCLGGGWVIAAIIVVVLFLRAPYGVEDEECGFIRTDEDGNPVEAE